MIKLSSRTKVSDVVIKFLISLFFLVWFSHELNLGPLFTEYSPVRLLLVSKQGKKLVY